MSSEQKHTRVSAPLGANQVTLETGKLAKQAGGSVVIQSGDTIVLVTATAAKEPKKDIDFLPLTVDYIEKTFAAGKIPGGFFKREGKPSDTATLTSRFIDRPLRPLFPENYFCETQVIATVLSFDPDHDPDILAITAASAALIISDVPFTKPVAGCRVGRIDGKYVINASSSVMENSDLDLIVVASADAVVMVEGGADEVSEKDMADAISFGHQSILPLLKAQKELQEKCGKPKREVPPSTKDASITEKVAGYEKAVHDAMKISVKQDRYQTLSDIKQRIVADLFPDEATREAKKVAQISSDYEDLKAKVMRSMILKDHKRIDGRGLADIRPITCEAGVLPRTHGSGLFTRGETQALVVATLGSTDDEQMIDAMSGSTTKKFMLHYNFPPFSVGEVKPLRSPGRREVGHGALAERAIARVLPDHIDFPYTIRVVSEVLESNGSSSMASVCGGSLSLMDAGVPLKAPVAGIAMGLIKEGNDIAVLSDILGDEDHLGDMDFKVTGTSKGVTAIQMDIKITGLTHDILAKALDQARTGRLHILEKMNAVLSTHREKLSDYAPKITTITVKKDKIRDVIGSGGKNIRSVVDETGVKIDVDDSGLVSIFGSDPKAIERAIEMIKAFVAEPEVGKIYDGIVKKLMDFGAFVEFLPKTDGLVHISQLSNERVQYVADVVQEGDHVKVKCIGFDDRGKVKLSMKDVPQE